MSPETSPNYPSAPIRPEDVLAVKMESFPDEVFIAVNGLIAERLQGQYAHITQKDIRQRMEELGLDKAEAKRRGWDDVGAIYQQAGWGVSYHSPGMDDNDYEPYYTFNTKGPRSW